MPEYDNTNRGVLFKNEDKKSSKAPDYSGNINMDGEERDISAWVRKAKKTGKIFISIKVELPQENNLVDEVEASAVLEEDIPY